MNAKVFIVGHGNIGQELTRQLQSLGWDIAYIAKSEGVYALKPDSTLSLIRKWGGDRHANLAVLNLRETRVAFLTIPASARGWASREYATFFARNRIGVVSCEKSLFAYYPTYLESFGCLASVGGGSHILPFLKEHVRGRHDVSVHAILNATLNFVMSGEDNVESRVAKAVEYGLVEDGTHDHLAVINGEIRDALLKTVIVANYCFRPPFSVSGKELLSPESIEVTYLNKIDVSRLESARDRYRFIVSFMRQEDCDNDTIGGFRCQTSNGWFISAGFKKLNNHVEFGRLIVPGSENSVLICENESNVQYFAAGPGAGAKATCTAMIQDAKRMLSIH
jgi:homoserine dehydrogenase